MRPPPQRPRVPPPLNARAREAVGTFLTGLLFLAPFIVTLMVIDWLMRQLIGIFGPGTLIGGALVTGGSLLVGESPLGVWVALAVVLTFIWAMGVFVQTRARTTIEATLDAWIDRVPVLRNIYKPVAQLVRMLGARDENDLKAMSVVSVSFGAERGASVLALLTSHTRYRVGAEDRLLVYLPTAPIPMTGGLVFVPPRSVEQVPEMAVDDLLKLYVSLGTLPPARLQVPPAGLSPAP